MQGKDVLPLDGGSLTRAANFSNPIPRRLDAFIPEIDFGLAAMVGDVNVHGEQDFSAEEASVGRVVRHAQLLFGEVWDHGGAIVEGIA
jgi:hypothetical protein